MKTGFLAVLCLFGMAFAFGPGFGMGAQEDVPLEARAEFMQATHEGDYETAMELHEEYGLGGKRMEHATPEFFELAAGMFEAQKSGNWLSAVGFQDQMVELVHEQIDAMRGEIPECEGEEGCRKRRPGKLPEMAEECKAALEENEDALAIREQIHAAMQSGERELAKELREQLREMLPEECEGMQQPRMRGHQMGKFSNTE